LQGQVTDKEDAGAEAENPIAEAQSAGHSDSSERKVSAIDVVENVKYEEKWQQAKADETPDVGFVNVDGRVNWGRRQSLPLSG